MYITSKLLPETPIAIEKAQNIIQNETLKNNLIFISVHIYNIILINSSNHLFCIIGKRFSSY
jgi:hypothetical protein